MTRTPAIRATGVFLLLLLAGCAPGAGPLRAQEPARVAGRPDLVVFVVVDQLRADLLTRYDDLFTGGFRRLRDDGRVYPNATHDHLVTETAPGHATLSTGTEPSHHGVTSNQWFEMRNGRWVGVENVVDPSRPVAGIPELPGASPSVLRRDALADWLVAADGSSRVVSLSGKPRGAVLLGGRDRPQVYWFEPAAGRFVTSTWYRDREADWVARFNAEELPAFGADSVWESTVPVAARARSRADTAAWEGDAVHTFFPHRYVDARDGYGGIGFWTWFAITPELDRATLALARRAVEAEELGAGGAPDLLALSLSQTDRVGHDYGPLSREQLDNLLRLDGELADFFAFLDERVGQGRWAVALAADHGAQDVPEAEVAAGVPAIRLNSDSLQSLQKVLTETARSVGSTEPEKLAEPLARRIVSLPWIARAWTHRGLARGEPADSFEVLARNSYYPGRPSGLLGRLGVEYMLAPHVLPFGYSTAGSTHQTGYYHDRHIPFVLWGAGVEPGVDPTRVSATDLAPTVAALLGIQPPDDVDGRVLGDALRRSSSPALPGSGSRRP